MMRDDPAENAIAEPARMGAHSISRPSTWAKGKKRSCRSVSRRLKARITLANDSTMFRWVNTTPLGRPVVPEV